VSGKNITRPLVMSPQVARTRNSQAILQRPSAENTPLGESPAQVPPGEERTSQGQGGKNKKPRELSGCLFRGPPSSASTIPQQISLNRRKQDLACPWRVGKAEKESLADTVKSTNKEGNILMNYSNMEC